MDHFNYQNQQLFAEDVAVRDIAQQFGTPTYIYSRATLERHYRVFDEVLSPHPHLICYAVKANSNLAVLNVLAKMGAGFDIVSGGELARVLAAGGDPSKVIFSGVGKLTWELENALAADIACFNVESKSELERLNQVAAGAGKVAPISLRVNPDVDAGSHPYISTGLKENKFGIEIANAKALYEFTKTLPNLRVTGVDCHIGSQLTALEPLLDALDCVYQLALDLRDSGFSIDHLDLGGGLGVRYHAEEPPSPADYASAIRDRYPDMDLKLILEPGRAIAANAGILVTTVEYLKHGDHKNFAVVDAAMNDLLRPALYNAFQEIIPVVDQAKVEAQKYDVVGPVCETSDFLGKDRMLALQPGDLLAIRGAGAYGFTMSSNYNTRPRAAEVMVDGSQVHCVRERETVEGLFVNENIVDE